MTAHPDKQAAMEPEEAKKATKERRDAEMRRCGDALSTPLPHSCCALLLCSPGLSLLEELRERGAGHLNATDSSRKQVQENFVKIQEAYELLSDPSKRKQYDSSLDFDESLGCPRKMPVREDS